MTLITGTDGYDSLFLDGENDIIVPVDSVFCRTSNPLALVIYAQDGSSKWHVCGNFADATGNILYSQPIQGNSTEVGSLNISTSHLFAESEGIYLVVFELVPLRPGQTTVSLEPSADFKLP